MDRVRSIKLIIAFCILFICQLTAISSAADPGGTLKWKFKIGEPNNSDSQSELSAAGDLKFKYDARLSGESSPAIATDGIIYVGSDDNHLYAINPNGTLNWRYQTEGDVRSSPALDSVGTIYFNSNDGYLYAVNSDGVFKWRYQTGYDVSNSPAIGSDGTIYVGTDEGITGGCLYAISPEGVLKWTYNTKSMWIVELTSPSIDSNGTIYFGIDENLYAVNPDSTLKWKYEAGSYIESPIAIGQDGTIYFGSGDDYLYAINHDGILKWRYLTGGDVSDSPVIGNDGAICFVSEDDYLYALNSDGTFKWKYKLGYWVYYFSSPTIGSDGTIYVGADKYLYAFNSDSTLKWEYEAENYVSTPPTINNDGTIYIICQEQLYAIDSGTGAGLADSPWPKFSHDLHNTGRYGAVVDTGSGSPTPEPTPEVSLTCGSVNSSPGSTVDIPISLDNTEVAIGGGQFVITPSPSNYVSFKGVNTTTRTTGWTISYNASGNGHIILFYSGSGATIAQGSGEIITISYEISLSSTTGTEIILTLSNAQISDNNQQSVNVTLQNGKITVAGCTLPGDVTGDGLVNIFDVLTIVKFALGQQLPTSQEFSCADMNEDGLINIFDVLACVNKALGRTLQLAGYREFDLSRVDLIQLKRDLKSLGADQLLIKDVEELFSKTRVNSGLPKFFSLSQNSPNPFNPSTSISYSIPDGKVVSMSLKVYDIRGRFVRTLAEGMREGGTYHVFWDGTDEAGHRLSSGIYIYRVQAGDFVQTRKMVLIK